MNVEGRYYLSGRRNHVEKEGYAHRYAGVFRAANIGEGHCLQSKPVGELAEWCANF